MNRGKFWPLAFTVLVTTVLMTQFIEDELPEHNGQLQPTLQNEADYVMTDAQITRFDNTGRAQNRISAERLMHYPKRNTTQLLKPHFEQIFPDKHWTISAPLGVLDETKHIMTLSDVVTFEGRIGTEHVIGSLKWLEIDLARKRLHSQSSIQLKSIAWVVTGEGLHVDIPRQKLKILRKVNAIYQAN